MANLFCLKIYFLNDVFFNLSKIICYSLCSIQVYVKKTAFKKETIKKDEQSLYTSFLFKLFFL